MIHLDIMNGWFASMVHRVAAWGLCLGTSAFAWEVDSTSNGVFDLYFFGNGEVGIFGTEKGDGTDAYRQTSGTVADASTYYWSDSYKQAMRNAVNTWTSIIATPYDTTKHTRKLRIGFFLDDATTVGGVMHSSMAGYAAVQTVTTNFDPQYGAGANIYSVAEWAWRDNHTTAYYKPSWVMDGTYWESNILASGDTSIDVAIVLNPVVTSSGTDAAGNYFYNKTARSIEELQNVATHEIGHGMGMNSYLYRQSGNATTALSGLVSTWDSLVTLNGEHIVTVQDGEIEAKYVTLEALQAAGWVCNGEDPYDPSSYDLTEIQYDPERRLSLENEVGVHISARMLEGDTLEHISSGDGTNVLGPGGRLNGVFSADDKRTLELLGWRLIPEPTTGLLSMLGLIGLALRRRR